MLSGKATLTAQEQRGYDLFRGKANCNTCHRDGGPGEEPFFTDFTASNIGAPADPLLPYYQEDHPDHFGYVANTYGASYVDLGVGAFLESKNCLSRPSVPDANWVKHAAANYGRMQVPTLRNVDKRPYPEFVQSLRTQWLFQEPRGDRSFLQHTGPASSMQARRRWGEKNMLASARNNLEHEYKDSRPSGP